MFMHKDGRSGRSLAPLQTRTAGDSVHLLFLEQGELPDATVLVHLWGNINCWTQARWQWENDKVHPSRKPVVTLKLGTVEGIKLASTSTSSLNSIFFCLSVSDEETKGSSFTLYLGEHRTVSNFYPQSLLIIPGVRRMDR
jgi:hypothetical protein